MRGNWFDSKTAKLQAGEYAAGGGVDFTEALAAFGDAGLGFGGQISADNVWTTVQLGVDSIDMDAPDDAVSNDYVTLQNVAGVASVVVLKDGLYALTLLAIWADTTADHIISFGVVGSSGTSTQIQAGCIASPASIHARLLLGSAMTTHLYPANTALAIPEAALSDIPTAELVLTVMPLLV